MKISEIEAIFKQANHEELQELFRTYSEDTRTGVQKIIARYKKQDAAYEKEVVAWDLKCQFDEVFHEGQKMIVGVDEVGRGPLAGPVVAAAVILPYDAKLVGLKDSKKLTEAKRNALFDEIQSVALAIGVGIVDAKTIDEINILQATFKAMRHALDELNTDIDTILVDGDKIIPQIEYIQHAVIGGDDKSASIAAASVIAKVTRDRMMEEYAEIYPDYDWASNKGYGSSKHYDAIKLKGMTPLHRRSFLKNIK